MSYLTGSLPQPLETAIASIAQSDAREAIRRGARAPWGDGETLADVADLVHALPAELRFAREEETDDGESVWRLAADWYDRVFRQTISAEAAR